MSKLFEAYGTLYTCLMSCAVHIAMTKSMETVIQTGWDILLQDEAM